jgi:hypothetical protein
MERLAKDKHSSLLQISVNYDSKKFYSTGPWSPNPPNFTESLKGFFVLEILRQLFVIKNIFFFFFC